jgi:hypothetical protein
MRVARLPDQEPGPLDGGPGGLVALNMTILAA